MDAIVYTSKTGHTEKYAQMLGRAINLKVMSLQEAKQLKSDSEVIYFGWLMAGAVKGYKRARRLFTVRAVVAVDMSQCDKQIDGIRKAYKIKTETPVYCIPGGFELEKLNGIYRFMMSAMKKAVCKGLIEKQDRTPEEDEILELFTNGGCRVSEENLKEIIMWYESLR